MKPPARAGGGEGAGAAGPMRRYVNRCISMEFGVSAAGRGRARAVGVVETVHIKGLYLSLSILG